ncbi:MAG: VTC domain-containing protein [FCB group bacterium]|nr:VTC domain-containing protein [FCB group bacterium]
MVIDAKSSQMSDTRIERKYFVTSLDTRELESIIKFHPALFQEIYYQRRVNNIYFDNCSFLNFRDNIDGSQYRLKVRIRWYGDLHGEIVKPVLEFKIKNGLVGWKSSRTLKSFDIGPGKLHERIKNVFSMSNLSEKIRELLALQMPVLLNSYKRKYYLSADGKFRLTLDTLMEYYRIIPSQSNFLGKYIDQDSRIVELKYAPNLDNEATNISSYFPFRVTKSSKYVSGIEFVNQL